MSKLLRGSTPLLALIAAGCVKDQDRAPFDPREFQMDERRAANELHRLARQCEAFDPERARLLRDAAGNRHRP